MITGMTVRKVTISVESSLLDEVDELATRAGLSRSEWLASAAQRTIQQAKLRAILDRAFAQAGGPPTQRERDKALRELGIEKRHGQRK